MPFLLALFGTIAIGIISAKDSGTAPALSQEDIRRMNSAMVGKSKQERKQIFNNFTRR